MLDQEVKEVKEYEESLIFRGPLVVWSYIVLGVTLASQFESLFLSECGVMMAVSYETKGFYH